MSKKRKYVALDESIQESGCGIENYIELPLRYLNMRNGEEKFFKHEEKEVQLNAEETAFVLVDIWGFSRMSERIKASCGRRSFCERADKIVTEKIKPSWMQQENWS